MPLLFLVPSTFMITRLVVPFSALLMACAGGPSQDFEAELDRLVAEFGSAVGDEAALEALEDRIEALDDRIADHRRDNRSTLSEEEYDRLEGLEDEAGAFEDVVRTIGQLSNSADVSVEDFELVNRRLGLEWEVVHEDDSGLEVVRIDVGSFRSFLVHNPTPETYIINYSWETAGDDGMGGGSASCGTLSVFASLLNSRDHDVDALEFTGLDASGLGAMGEGSGLNECG